MNPAYGNCWTVLVHNLAARAAIVGSATALVVALVVWVLAAPLYEPPVDVCSDLAVAVSELQRDFVREGRRGNLNDLAQVPAGRWTNLSAIPQFVWVADAEHAGRLVEYWILMVDPNVACIAHDVDPRSIGGRTVECVELDQGRILGICSTPPGVVTDRLMR